MAKDQKRNRKGQFATTGKAKKVTPDSTPRPPSSTAVIDKEKPQAKAPRTQTAPKGHLGDGIESIHEYVELARRVYIAFLKRMGK